MSSGHVGPGSGRVMLDTSVGGIPQHWELPLAHHRHHHKCGGETEWGGWISAGSVSHENSNGAYLLPLLPAGQEGSEREKSEMEKEKKKQTKTFKTKPYML